MLQLLHVSLPWLEPHLTPRGPVQPLTEPLQEPLHPHTKTRVPSKPCHPTHPTPAQHGTAHHTCRNCWYISSSSSGSRSGSNSANSRSNISGSNSCSAMGCLLRVRRQIASLSSSPAAVSPAALAAAVLEAAARPDSPDRLGEPVAVTAAAAAAARVDALVPCFWGDSSCVRGCCAGDCGCCLLGRCCRAGGACLGGGGDMSVFVPPPAC